MALAVREWPALHMCETQPQLPYFSRRLQLLEIRWFRWMLEHSYLLYIDTRSRKHKCSQKVPHVYICFTARLAQIWSTEGECCHLVALRSRWPHLSWRRRGSCEVRTWLWACLTQLRFSKIASCLKSLREPFLLPYARGSAPFCLVPPSLSRVKALCTFREPHRRTWKDPKCLWGVPLSLFGRLNALKLLWCILYHPQSLLRSVSCHCYRRLNALVLSSSCSRGS